MSRVLTSLFALAFVACSGDSGGPATPDKAPKATPEPAAAPAPEVFKLAWSEYPSWSTFGVADELGLVKAKEGELGSIEKKWNIDIVLKEADYDTCMQLYGSSQVDAAALTNMDSLPSALGRKTVGILPTSTSFGADALITTKDVTELEQLKGKKVYGLALTVSEYTFARNLVLKGLDPKEFEFSNMDPAAAATAMQQRQDGYDAIVVWNPFVLSVLSSRDDVHVLADSKAIPGEIVDMIVMGQDSLDRPGGDKFASAVVDTFYAISDRIEDPKSRDETLVALGAKFAKLDLETMKTVVEQTQFYKTPADGLSLFEGEALPKVMETVTAFAVDRGIVETAPSLAYGTKAEHPDAQFRFDPTYIKAVVSRTK